MEEEGEDFLILDDDEDETPVSKKPEETPVLPSMPKLPSLRMPGFLRRKSKEEPEPEPSRRLRQLPNPQPVCSMRIWPPTASTSSSGPSEGWTAPTAR